MGYSVAGNLWILKQVWAFLIGRLGVGGQSGLSSTYIFHLKIWNQSLVCAHPQHSVIVY